MHLTYSFALLAQTEKVAPTQNQILPADFPKYTDTGKPEQDNQKYNAAKQVWIAANPAVYEKIVAQQQATPKNKLEAEISPAPPATQITEMIPPYNPTSTANLSKQTPNYNKEQQLSTTAEPFADFPKYTDTGKPEQDNQKYNAAKQAWIAANPAVYEKINANIAPVQEIKNTTIVPELTNNDVSAKIFANQNFYKTDKLTLLAAQQAVTPEDLSEIKEKNKEDVINVSIDWENKTWYQKNNLSELKCYKIKVTNNELFLTNCEECQNMQLILLEDSPTQLKIKIIEHKDDKYYYELLLIKK